MKIEEKVISPPLIEFTHINASLFEDNLFKLKFGDQSYICTLNEIKFLNYKLQTLIYIHT